MVHSRQFAFADARAERWLDPIFAAIDGEHRDVFTTIFVVPCGEVNDGYHGPEVLQRRRNC